MLGAVRSFIPIRRRLMSMIRISSEESTFLIQLNDSLTATLLRASLPLEATVNTWGREIYFETPVTAKLEPDARTEVSIGDVAYWPPGKALCVFFGTTPASTGSRPRAASPVTVIGKVCGDPLDFAELHDGESIRVREEVADGDGALPAES
jgi:hypothetical protein